MAPESAPFPFPPETGNRPPRPLSPRTWPRWVLGTAIALVVLLAALRLALPSIVLWYVNRTLDDIPPYHGQAGAIGISLWRGAYQIYDLKLVKREGKKPAVPFFSCPVTDLSVKWAGLVHGSVVGKATLWQPKLNFVADSDDGAQQTGISASWTDTFARLFPLKIDRAAIHDGEIWFHNETSHPPVHLKLDRLEASAENLVNSRRLSDTLVTTIEADARLMESGKLHALVKSDVFVKPPSFELQLSVDALDLVKLNDFFKAYLNVRMESGTFDLYSQLKSNHGNFSGYLKPLLDHVNVEIGKDPNPFQAVWDAVVATFLEILRNQPKDRIATVIPVSGSVQDPHFGVLDSLFNILRNAFIHSFLPGFENAVSSDHPAAALKTPPPQPTEKAPDQSADKKAAKEKKAEKNAGADAAAKQAAQ